MTHRAVKIGEIIMMMIIGIYMYFKVSWMNATKNHGHMTFICNNGVQQQETIYLNSFLQQYTIAWLSYAMVFSLHK